MQEALYELGVFFSQQGNLEEAYNQMFKIITIDRNWNNQAAKEFLLKVRGILRSYWTTLELWFPWKW